MTSCFFQVLARRFRPRTVRARLNFSEHARARTSATTTVSRSCFYGLIVVLKSVGVRRPPSVAFSQTFRTRMSGVAGNGPGLEKLRHLMNSTVKEDFHVRQGALHFLRSDGSLDALGDVGENLDADPTNPARHGSMFGPWRISSIQLGTALHRPRCYTCSGSSPRRTSSRSASGRAENRLGDTAGLENDRREAD